MAKGFEGWYYKHQKDGRTLSLIPGRSQEGAFLQVITDSASFFVPYPASAYRRHGKSVKVGGSAFSPDGVRLDIDAPGLRLTGSLAYANITPPVGDVMGPFRYLSMQCRHTVASLYHQTSGNVRLNDENLSFGGGVGYIEGDSGRSFPDEYAWLHCNAFPEKASVMISVATIPFFGFRFTGCIALVWYEGREYRLATYSGVHVETMTQHQIVLSQGNLRLLADIHPSDGQPLLAPTRGRMSRTIHESAAVHARIRFYVDGKQHFDLKSPYAGFEWAWEM